MNKEQYVPQFQVRSHIRSGAGGGYVNGAWYPDQSGVCGGMTPPVVNPPTYPPATGNGGYVGGIWFSDKSGTCG